MTYALKPLPFDPARLQGLSEKLILSHYENNYGGAVKRLNAIGEQLRSLDFSTAPGFVINGLKREELMAANSMILHERYFESLGGIGGRPSGLLHNALVRDFGSFERWQAEFVGMGKALGGGSGWVLLTFSPRDDQLINQWAPDHTHALAGGVPLLALDMYEHAYHMDFGAKAAAYVEAFMANLHWERVTARYADLEGRAFRTARYRYPHLEIDQARCAGAGPQDWSPESVGERVGRRRWTYPRELPAAYFTA